MNKYKIRFLNHIITNLSNYLVLSIILQTNNCVIKDVENVTVNLVLGC